MYEVPVFNLTVNVWRWLSYPGAPTLITIANLQYGRRFAQVNTTWVTHPSGLPPEPREMYLLVPKLTDVREGDDTGGRGDVVEAPAGSGRFYAIISVDDVGKGFANEFRVASMYKLYPWAYPYA